MNKSPTVIYSCLYFELSESKILQLEVGMDNCLLLEALRGLLSCQSATLPKYQKPEQSHENYRVQTLPPCPPTKIWWAHFLWPGQSEALCWWRRKEGNCSRKEEAECSENGTKLNTRAPDYQLGDLAQSAQPLWTWGSHVKIRFLVPPPHTHIEIYIVAHGSYAKEPLNKFIPPSPLHLWLNLKDRIARPFSLSGNERPSEMVSNWGRPRDNVPSQESEFCLLGTKIRVEHFLTPPPKKSVT